MEDYSNAMRRAVDASEQMNMTVRDYEVLLSKIADRTLDSAIAVEEDSRVVTGFEGALSSSGNGTPYASDKSFIKSELEIASALTPEIPEPEAFDYSALEALGQGIGSLEGTVATLLSDLTTSKVGVDGFDTKVEGFEGVPVDKISESLLEFSSDVKKANTEALNEIITVRDNIITAFEKNQISQSEMESAWLNWKRWVLLQFISKIQFQSWMHSKIPLIRWGGPYRDISRQ